MFFACVSTLVTIVSVLAGVPIWAPPDFQINWQAFAAARQGRGSWDAYAFPDV
jgi:hypothetical protein